jgi:hypothetical protein
MSQVKTVAGIVGVSLAYATLRYNVFKDVPWSQWPAWVTNKAAALAALLLLLAALLRAGRDGGHGRLLAAASILAMIHITLSLALLGPAAYPGLFANGLPTMPASLSLLLGVVAAVAAPRVSRPEGPGAPPRFRPGPVAMLALVVGLHAGLLGFRGWATPGKWPGGMPPITLISFAAGLLAVILGWKRHREGTARPPRTGAHDAAN